MSAGGPYLRTAAWANWSFPFAPSSINLEHHLEHSFAFAGDLARYEESVCAMHLSLGGPPATAAELVDSRTTPDMGIDWVAEGARCSVPIDDDELDARWFALVQRHLDAAVVRANATGAMGRCLTMMVDARPSTVARAGQ